MCVMIDVNVCDCLVLNFVVIGLNGDVLYLIDGYYGLLIYYEMFDGGLVLYVYVVVKDNFSDYLGDVFW